MKRSKQLLSFGLSAILAFYTPLPAVAAADSPQCDETLYVTLDPYGEIREGSVVKSYSMNGNTRIVDYGAYEHVTNMTNHTEPQIGGDGSVTFELEPGADRFYFEGKTEVSPRDLPWNIRVGYRLNGVDRKAEELAGATGLVEVNIDITPNPEVSDYFKNNMVLSAATVVDMDKNLSVEAEGAQIQAMGNINAVAFFVLPGEERHYSIRIGSEDFRFPGLVFMMVPLKVSQLDKVTDLRDAKETLEDSADAISDSLDIVLSTMEGMQKSIGDTADGLRELDQTRQLIQSTKGKVYDDADAALADLNTLSSSLAPFKEHTQQAQNALDRINSNINEIVAALDDLSPQLGILKDNVHALRDDLDQIKTVINSPAFNAASKDFIDHLEQTKRDLIALASAQGGLNSSLKGLEGTLAALLANSNTLDVISSALTSDFSNDDIKDLVEDLQANAGSIANAEDLANYLSNEGYDPSDVEQLLLILRNFVDYGDSGTTVATPSSASLSRARKNAASAIPPGELSALMADLDGIINGTIGSVGNQSLTGDAAYLIGATEQLLISLDAQKGTLNHSLDTFHDLATTAGKIADSADDLISGIDDLNYTVNIYHEDMIQTLADAGALTEDAARGVHSLYVFFTSLEGQIKTVGDSLNSSTQKTLNGLADTLDEAGDGLAQTSVVRSAKDIIKKLVEDKWDEYTGEKTTILNADIEASPVSLTSAKNPSPRSIQMVLRTEEIKEQEPAVSADVDENFHPEGNIFHRIANIFRRIWEAILSIFQ